MTLDILKQQLNTITEAKEAAEKAKLCRELLSSAVDTIYASAGEAKPAQASLLELLDGPVVKQYVNDEEVLNALHFVRILGMNAAHDIKVKKGEAKLAVENISYLIGLMEAKEAGTAGSYAKPPYMSEANTRKLYIDLYLAEAGWEVLETENTAVPGKAGIEIEVEGMPSGTGFGYCDYVLYGRDGKPLAIVEAKKTSVDESVGRHQVDLYGECMKAKWGYKPVLYYTNGYNIKIIDGVYPDRRVMAFHTAEELELMLQRRNRGDITDISVNKDITDRAYQEMAITNVCERLNAKQRRALVVMATGTGKTRLAISLVDILSKNNWVKNVLFLADRTALVNQAKRNFVKLLPSMSACELSGSGEKDYNARLMFSTYQTMINYIDAEDKRFSSGRFDLIIIDEAHRSIFNRYSSIFAYFDCLLVGLTATPKDEVGKNTYDVFNCEPGVPTFDYSLKDAINEHYLVGYEVINRESRLIKDGIDYGKLSKEEREQLDDYLDGEPPTPDFTIPGNEIFRYLYNEETCCKVLEELMVQGLKVNSGENIGKTIIFAYNHKHAQMIVDCFKKLYPQFPANYCQLVDNTVNYADDLVIKFDTDDDFRIAVSVDMLDTGVDVPAVLNLVFFKPLKSKIKFMQMIGRGTRLCKDIYGPGKNKSGFRIFDYCGNFEYFGENPEGADSGKQVLSLTQKLFEIRLDVLYALQAIEYQQDAYAKAYYEKLKDILHLQVAEIKGHSNRIQVREQMQYVDKYYDLENWICLSPVQVKEIKSHLTQLLDSGLNGKDLMIAFDIRMLDIELSLLDRGDISQAKRDVKNVMLCAQYLLTNKASIPQVAAKSAYLQTIISPQFWAAPTLDKLEDLRENLRDLMQYLETDGKGKYDINISDDITDADYEVDSTIVDIRTYREKVIDYLAEHTDIEVIRKIQNLEPINNDDLQQLEHILWEELGTKEEYAEATDIENLAAFVRSLIGLSQEAVNEKFGEYLRGNKFNARQQEFIRTIINYVRENGDISPADMVNTEPFSDYDITAMFGVDIVAIVNIINMLHNCVQVA